jgi:simple sugar transport system ATP-binding protein
VNITKRYGSTTALDGVKILVPEGDSHALVGRNGAGKSTLVSILTGLQTPDAGQVFFQGERAPSPADRDAWRRRVACVYQKSAIIATLTVAENLFLNRQESSFGGLINWRSVRLKAQGLLDEYGVEVDARRSAADLSVEQRQMVEIARALSFGARFIILDEPTAQLDSKGIERLFTRLREMQSRGVSMLFISHHLEEIYEVCQNVTVYRDARHILTAPVSELPKSELISAMTGEASTARGTTSSTTTRQEGAAVLRVDALSATGSFDDVTFEIKPGEVIGITGSASSGRIALAEAIVGLRTPRAGSVEVSGRRLKPGSVPAALAAGIGFVPRDRHHEGFVPWLSVAENMTMTIPERFGRAGLMDLKRRDQTARGLMKELSVVASGPEQEVSSLSGGNQQKVVMGRALANQPRVLVLIHPTAGVDVRSKETLLEVVDEVRANGTGVLIVSDELEDLLPCDRVLVMLHGIVVREFARGWKDQDVVAAVEGVGTENV